MPTRPYPWPYDGVLDPGRLALLIVGAQEWWVERTHEPHDALAALERAAKAVRDAGGVVVVVRHDDSDPALAFVPEPADVVVGAAGFSGFAGGPLDEVLRARGRDRLAVGGLGLETAVYSTMSSANDRGYECLALSDASAAHDPAVAERALASMTMSGGIFGAVGTTSDLLDLLAKEPA